MEVLKGMTVDSARLTLVSKALDPVCTSSEPWYDARYMKFQSIKRCWKDKWQGIESGLWNSVAQQAGLGLPRRNSFLPTDFALRPVDARPFPQEMEVSQSWCRAWLRPTTAMQQPKVAASFCLRSAVLENSEDVALAHILCKCLEQAFRAEAFEARMAGAMYKLDVADHCLLLQFLGFRDKMATLASAAATSLCTMSQIPREMFLQAKAQQELILEEKLACEGWVCVPWL